MLYSLSLQCYPSLIDLHTLGQVAMSNKAKLVPTNVHNARAPRPEYVAMTPIRSKRFEKLRERFWKGELWWLILFKRIMISLVSDEGRYEILSCYQLFFRWLSSYKF